VSLERMAIGIMLGVGEDPRESLRKAKEIGVDNVQMGVPPDKYLEGEGLEELRSALKEFGIKVTTVFCGFEGESYADIPTVRKTVGFVPRGRRAERIRKAMKISDFAKEIGCDRIAAHVGFIPEDPSDPLYGEVVEAVREVAEYCKENGQLFCLETGQETAQTLLRFIKDVGMDNIRVNFDPANMILYGVGDPIEALELLKDYVVGVHCKDGKWPTEKDKLGHEVPLGEGDVGIERFIEKLKEIGYTGPLTIEREITGEEQKRDMLKAKALLERLRNRG
jgi:sugar phosphate isomerase/epimerase